MHFCFPLVYGYTSTIYCTAIRHIFLMFASIALAIFSIYTLEYSTDELHGLRNEMHQWDKSEFNDDWRKTSFCEFDSFKSIFEYFL